MGRLGWREGHTSHRWVDAVRFLNELARFLRQTALSLLAGLLTLPLLGAEAGPDASKLTPVPPCPALMAAAQAQHIPLDGIEPPGEPGRLKPGDSCTGLVTLSEKGGRRTQWLFYLSAVANAPKDAGRNPPESLILYSGRSNRLQYASAPAWVLLRTLGPYVENGTSRDRAKPKDESVSFSLNKGFLGIGLDLAAATICRAEQINGGNLDGAFWFSPEPPNSSVVAKAQKTAEILQLSVDEERALGGVLPTLFSYGDIIEHTKGLQDIMMKVVEKPSIWSVVGHLGVRVNLIIDSKDVGREDLGSWGWNGNPAAYQFPMFMQINGRLALTVTLVVTSPRPPLLACGGIVGMLAEKPGDKSTYMTWRIISARYGHETPR